MQGYVATMNILRVQHSDTIRVQRLEKREPMEIVILASHGKLASGMKSTIKMISGLDDKIFAFDMLEGENTETLFLNVNNLISELGEDKTYVMFSDLAGGSVNTALTQLLVKDNFNLISGMNLPAILEFVLGCEENLELKMENAVNVGKKSLGVITIEEHIEEDMWED